MLHCKNSEDCGLRMVRTANDACQLQSTAGKPGQPPISQRPAAGVIMAGMSGLNSRPGSLPLAALVREGALRLAAGQNESAIALLSDGLGNYPDAPDLLYLLGAAKAVMGASAEAEEFYRRALAARPDDPHFLVELGKLLRISGRAGEALACFDTALRRAPRDASLWMHRGQALADRGRHQEALAAFARATDLAPDMAEARTSHAATLTSLGRPLEALSAHDRVLAIRPNFVPALNGRAVVLLALRRFEDALTACDRALAAAPGDIQAANNRALALQGLGRTKEAIQALDTLLAGVPSYAEGWSNRGTLLHGAGQGEEALESFDRALTIMPDNSEIWIRRAVALQGLCRFAEARQSLEKAIALAPLSAAPWRNMGLLLWESGDIEGGLDAFRRHASLAPPASDSSQHKDRHDAERREYLATCRDVSDPGARLTGRALNPQSPERPAARSWRENRPQIVVIDNFLTPEALQALRVLCLRGDVWHRSYDNGYLGAMPEAGFAYPLLGQVAAEMGEAYPEIFAGHALRYFWGFKYDSSLSGIAVHADQAAVNVNFWITPDEANLDPQSGGLVIWDKAAPADWDFDRFNSDPGACTAFLNASGAVSQTIPYRCNRAVIFDSDLFHATDTIRFRGGYENRRINLTFLFGRRIAGGTFGTPANAPVR